jgi:hypothetical protein
MTNVLFIESRAGFDRDGNGFCASLAPMLSRDGAQVAVMLVQNGVLPARRGACAPALAAMAAAGVRLYADEFSLRERGIAADRLNPGVHAAPLELVIDRLADGWRVIWH